MPAKPTPNLNDASYHLCLARGLVNVISEHVSTLDVGGDVGDALSAVLYHVCEAKRIVDNDPPAAKEVA